VKEVNVQFGSGQEVLTAYWGFLSDGGLVIPDAGELNEGQAVRLRVRIASSAKDYDLGGRVVRLHADDRQAIVAFDPGEPHDMLLTAALAETDDVPARRYPRISVTLPAEVTSGGDAATGQLHDVSLGGCCVKLDRGSPAFSVGSVVTVATQTFASTGTVVWRRGPDCGVSFDDAGTEAVTPYIESL